MIFKDINRITITMEESDYPPDVLLVRARIHRKYKDNVEKSWYISKFQLADDFKSNFERSVDHAKRQMLAYIREYEPEILPEINGIDNAKI